MNYWQFLLLLFGGLFALYLLYAFWRRQRRAALERELENMPFPVKARETLRRIPHYDKLSPEEHAHMERLMLRFIRTAEFRGVGLEVTDEMRSVVAFYVSLMLLHSEEAWMERAEAVVLYAEDFVVDHSYEEGGIVTEGPMVLDGQSTPDTLVLAWEIARKEAYTHTCDNVIIHEMAHLLDYMDGESDGVPPMGREAAAEFEEVMSRHLEGLQEEVARGEEGEYALYPDDAAQNGAEFFAVSSELFFQCPAKLHEDFPDIFIALESFYGTDTRRWLGGYAL